MVVTKYNKLFKTISPDNYTVILKGGHTKNIISLQSNPEGFEDFELQAICTKQSKLIPTKEQ